MEPIDFSQFGADFVTRRQGELVREKLKEAIENSIEEESVTVSLTEIEAMSPSFADECFGKLLLLLGTDQFKRKVIISGANEVNKALLNAILTKRSQEHSHSI